jgi:hypothetical protein
MNRRKDIMASKVNAHPLESLTPPPVGFRERNVGSKRMQARGMALEKMPDLVSDIKAGHLDARIGIGDLGGNDREMVERINNLVDGIVQPLKVAAEYIGHISKGDIPAKIGCLSGRLQ